MGSSLSGMDDLLNARQRSAGGDCQEFRDLRVGGSRVDFFICVRKLDFAVAFQSWVTRETFDEMEKLLANRFFLREEGGPNVREIYVALRLKRAKSTAAHAECPCALDINRHLGEPVASLPFTANGLDPFISSVASKQSAADWIGQH